jgi:pimeloyl-ACP methyl ester carboxylesterase
MFPGSRFDASALDGVVDVSRLVAMGHSFGGSTVMTAIGKDAAIKRAVLLDPWTEPLGGVVAVRAVSIPTLVLNSHNWSRDQDLQSLYRKSTAVWLEAEVADTTHQDCSDQMLRMPLATKMFTRRVKRSVNIHKYYDFYLALLHLFFELTHLKHAEESGSVGGGLAVALHEGAVELVRDYRGELEIRMRSSASG